MTRSKDRAGAAFGRMDAPATKQQPEPPTTSARSTPRSATAGPSPAAVSKYTILLGDEDAMLWDQLAMTLRRERGGRKVDKSQMLRALVYLAAEDEDLRRQVVETLERDGMP